MIGLAVAGAAALGAVARFLVDLVVVRTMPRSWPAGTLVVNLTGSLALGVLAGVGLRHGVPTEVRATVGTGFIGAYTTFSAFAFEAADLARRGEGPIAIGYVAASLAAGLGVAWLGVTVGTRL